MLTRGVVLVLLLAGWYFRLWDTLVGIHLDVRAAWLSVVGSSWEYADLAYDWAIMLLLAAFTVWLLWPLHDVLSAGDSATGTRWTRDHLDEHG